MWSVVDSTGLSCASQAVSGALLLLPVSLVPAIMPTGGSPLVYLVWTFGLGCIQLALAVRFALRRDDRSARLLLRTTLLYLPAWMVMLLIVTL